MKKVLLVLFITIHVTIFSQSKIVGTYFNNVAINGFFGEELTLNGDSTFNYYTGGDMSHQYGSGKYLIKKNIIVLHFNKVDYGNIDSLISKGKITYRAFDSIGNKILEKKNPKLNQFDKLLNLEILDINDILVDTMSFIIRGEKLLCIGNNGRIIRKVPALSKRRKYFIWGEPYMKKRKYYLKKE